MLTKGTKLYVFASAQADGNYNSLVLRTQQGGGTWGKGARGRRTLHRLFTSPLFGWEGEVQEHNIFMYPPYHLEKSHRTDLKIAPQPPKQGFVFWCETDRAIWTSFGATLQGLPKSD